MAQTNTKKENRAPAAPRSIYLLAGKRSATGRDPLLHPVFSQTGESQPSIAYVGAASGDDRSFLRWLTATFKDAGAGEVRLAPMATPGADLDEAREVLTRSDLIFITGGDVEEGMRILNERGMLPLLGKLHRQGVPFFGLSAGSIMLAQCWVRWRDPDDESTAEAFACLGLAPVMCDVHAESDDWEELHALLSLTGEQAVGYGIPSGGALRVDPDGTVRAQGKAACRFVHRHGRIVPLKDVEPE